MRGTPRIPFSSLVADTIACHGLQWAVTYYAKRLPRHELRVFMRAAYLGGA
jgi:hypothetical protein